MFPYNDPQMNLDLARQRADDLRRDAKRPLRGGRHRRPRTGRPR